MNILLTIPDDIVEKYQEAAKKEKRSRKNLMEMVLCGMFDVQSPPTTVKDFTQETKTNYVIDTRTDMQKKMDEYRRQFLKNK